MRKLGLLPLAVALIFAAGCGDDGGESGAGTTTGSSSASGAGKKIAYVSPVAAQPGQQDIGFGMETGAKELGWTSEVLDANLAPDKQVAAVDAAISKQLDAIGSWSLDAAALAGAYERALAAGIPVISMNTEGEKVTGSIWNEHLLCVPGGSQEKLAEFIADRIPGAKTVIMTGPPAPSIVAMTKCFTDAAKQAGLQIVATKANTSDTAEAAQRLMGDILTKHPDVQAVWNYNDQSALGDAAALQARNKDIATISKDGIIVIGHNGDADAIAAVKDGRMTGTWDPNYVATGLAFTRQMNEAMKAGGADASVPKVTVKGDFWTSENVGTYKPGKERGYTLDSFPTVDSAG
jgi:ribose transport system substrate-binding protein